MRQIVLIALLAVLSFASCKYVGAERVRGNGTYIAEERAAGNFHSISSFGSYDVYLTQGTGYKVHVEADDNLLPYIETVVENNVLEIRTKKGYWLSSRN